MFGAILNKLERATLNQTSDYFVALAKTLDEGPLSKTDAQNMFTVR